MNLKIGALAAVWLFAVSVGLVQLYNYGAKPGVLSAVIVRWPIETVIKKGNAPFQLVMVAHPRCPCTRASIGELESIMTKARGQINAHILFVKPKEVSRDWTETDLVETAKKIPGVNVYIDQEAKQAKLFGGTTSGQIFLFDTIGKPVFSGGITASRGHSGDNLGKKNILALINNKSIAQTKTPFFGCLLDGPTRPFAEAANENISNP